MSPDPEAPRVDPSKFPKKPKPTSRKMVDLELDDGWLNPKQGTDLKSINVIAEEPIAKQKAEPKLTSEEADIETKPILEVPPPLPAPVIEEINNPEDIAVQEIENSDDLGENLEIETRPMLEVPEVQPEEVGKELAKTADLVDEVFEADIEFVEAETQPTLEVPEISAELEDQEALAVTDALDKGFEQGTGEPEIDTSPLPEEPLELMEDELDPVREQVINPENEAQVNSDVPSMMPIRERDQQSETVVIEANHEIEDEMVADKVEHALEAPQGMPIREKDQSIVEPNPMQENELIEIESGPLLDSPQVMPAHEDKQIEEPADLLEQEPTELDEPAEAEPVSQQYEPDSAAAPQIDPVREMDQVIEPDKAIDIQDKTLLEDEESIQEDGSAVEPTLGEGVIEEDPAGAAPISLQDETASVDVLQVAPIREAKAELNGQVVEAVTEPAPEPDAATRAELAAMAELTKPMTPVLDVPLQAPERALEEIVVDTVGEMPPILLGAGIFAGLLLFLVMVAIIVSIVAFGNFSFSPLPSEPVVEQFDNGQSSYWVPSSIKQEYEEDSTALLIVQEAFFNDGGFQLKNDVERSLYWVAADARLGSGIYSTDITFLSDEPETGAGIAFLLEDQSFYLVEIGPDGFAWIGRCEDGCAVATPLVKNGWFEAKSVNTGVGATNQITIEVNRGQIAVLVNGDEIGFVADRAIRGTGTVAFLVETGGAGSTSARFDNFAWTP